VPTNPKASVPSAQMAQVLIVLPSWDWSLFVQSVPPDWTKDSVLSLKSFLCVLGASVVKNRILILEDFHGEKNTRTDCEAGLGRS